MNQESERVLSKVGELVEKEKLNPKQKYLRVKEAVKVYPMSRTKLTEEALKCGALHKVGSITLGVIIFGAAVVMCFFGEFESTREIISLFGIAAALVIAPNFLVNVIGDVILYVKDSLFLLIRKK